MSCGWSFKLGMISCTLRNFRGVNASQKTQRRRKKLGQDTKQSSCTCQEDQTTNKQEEGEAEGQSEREEKQTKKIKKNTTAAVGSCCSFLLGKQESPQCPRCSSLLLISPVSTSPLSLRSGHQSPRLSYTAHRRPTWTDNLTNFVRLCLAPSLLQTTEDGHRLCAGGARKHRAVRVHRYQG